MKKRNSYERRKLTFKKCKQRYDLYNNIIVGGGIYDDENKHRYAKSGMTFIKDNEAYSPRDMRINANTDYELYDYFCEVCD